VELTTSLAFVYSAIRLKIGHWIVVDSGSTKYCPVLENRVGDSIKCAEVVISDIET
jgi:hypothetical protein